MGPITAREDSRVTPRIEFAPQPPLAARKEEKRQAELFAGFIGTPLEDQLRLVQQALSQLRESVVITTTELEEPGPHIVYVNPAFTRMTGWQPEELIGKNPRILQGPKTTRKTLDRLRAQLAKGEPFEGQDINYRKDGSSFYIDWYIEPLRDESGAITYWVAVQRDVTERNELQAQLLHAQRLEGIGLLASGIAHDLNNVLAPVMIACDVLCDRVTDAEGQQFLKLLQSSAKRGASLVKQILSFARGIGGGSGLIDPRQIVNEVLSLARATFPKEIKIVEESEGEVGLVEGDATQLHQVLLNLCVNARDAIGDSGTITLRARQRTLTEQLHGVRGDLPPGNYAVLEVSDTGSGMPPEVAGKIFEPFFSTKAPGKGTGLGLSTVAMIVQNQKGGILLQTAPGEGTTFSIYLPAAEPKAEAGGTGGEEANAGQGRSVLIVDDEAAVAEIMREALEGASYRVTITADVAKAVSAAGEAQPDIVIIDPHTSNIGGPAATRELRSRFPKTRMVAIANRQADELPEGTPEADAILQKPFTLRELLQAVSGA